MSEAREFDGGVLSPSLAGGRSGARVRVGFDGVTARTPEGDEVSLSYEDCALSLGGASERMWFFRHRAGEPTIFSEDPGLAQLLNRDPPRLLRDELARVLVGRAAQQRTHAKYWAAGLIAAALVGVGATYGLRGVGRAAVHALPFAVDTKLGDLAASTMDMGGAGSNDPVLIAAVAEIEKRLAAQIKPTVAFKMRVVQSDTVNAFALPGGNIVVFTGLLREAGSADEVAGVLAHEMAHVTRRHGMERIAQSLGLVAAIQLLLGDVSGLLAVGVQLFQVGTINSYGREQEHEADMDGVDTLLAAKLDPEALARFFERLQKSQADMPEVLSWLGTHPELGQRIGDVRARAKAAKHADFEPLTLDFENVRRHAGAVVDVTPIAH